MKLSIVLTISQVKLVIKKVPIYITPVILPLTNRDFKGFIYLINCLLNKKVFKLSSVGLDFK